MTDSANGVRVSWKARPAPWFVFLLVLGTAHGGLGLKTVGRSEAEAGNHDELDAFILPQVKAESGKLAVIENQIETVLVVPKLKFMFCFIGKNACTQFNRVMNVLNGFNKGGGKICSNNDPNFKSSYKYRFNKPKQVESILNGEDPSWMRAVFLRDPLERLVSAWQSKCAEPRECGECPGSPASIICDMRSMFPKLAKGADANETCSPTFEHVVKLMPEYVNLHFTPQASFCGGLNRKKLTTLDYVGQISSNYTDVTRQVEEMLNMLLERHPEAAKPFLNLNAMDQAANGGLPSDPEEAAVAGAAQLRFAKQLATEFFGDVSEEGASRSAAMRFFPEAGPDASETHIHRFNRDDKVRAFFENATLSNKTETLVQALRYYKDDYEQLPGMFLPSWASDAVIREAGVNAPKAPAVAA